MIIPGIIIGAFISAFISGQFHIFWVPGRWGDAFGYDTVIRIIAAIGGGILLGLGARWAGGCTSGQGSMGRSSSRLPESSLRVVSLLGGDCDRFVYLPCHCGVREE